MEALLIVFIFSEFSISESDEAGCGVLDIRCRKDGEFGGDDLDVDGLCGEDDRDADGFCAGTDPDVDGLCGEDDRDADGFCDGADRDVEDLCSGAGSIPNTDPAWVTALSKDNILTTVSSQDESVTILFGPPPVAWLSFLLKANFFFTFCR